MLEDHRLLRTQVIHSKDTFSRYVGPNASGKPQRYGASIQLHVLTTDQSLRSWPPIIYSDVTIKPLMGAKVSDDRLPPRETR
jgi:hypothetical protein